MHTSLPSWKKTKCRTAARFSLLLRHSLFILKKNDLPAAEVFPRFRKAPPHVSF
jgi:hypothetical protein